MSLLKASILVIDDDVDVLTAVRLLLKNELQEVVTEKNPENIPSLLSSRSFDLVLLDMNFNASINTGNEGLYWLNRIREMKPGISVIMITAYGDIDLAVRSLKEGAADFIVKPWHNEKLLSTITGILKKNSPQTSSASPSASAQNTYPDLLGNSDVMLDIFSKIDKMLFGHKKGAFTDAREDRMGRFEMASGGTLFLDEIGNISLQQQAKLLSVLQNRQVTRLGSNLAIPVDIRLICATNLPMSDLANETRFRKDLIYRINTVEIVVPPLRKRKEDIRLLTEHFVKIYAAKYFKTNIRFSDAAIQKLELYRFPGNVRELQYIIERVIIMSEGHDIKPEEIIFSPIESNHQESLAETDETRLSNIEKNTILRVIEKNNGNISKAARELGITRTALYRRLSKYEI